MKRALRVFLFAAGIVLLAFFAAMSFFSLSDSFASYRLMKEHAEHALLEKLYVEQQLRDVRASSTRQGYDIENVNIVEKTSLNRIDLRGVGLTPGEHRPFSPSEVELTVLRQDHGHSEGAGD